MSTTTRTTQRGGKNSKSTETNVTVNKTQKPEVKIDSTKSLPTAEQMRIAQIIGTKSEDPSLKNKIKQVMDATRKSEDEVCTALHDCDNDANRAVNYLLEGGDNKQSEWLTSGKKKKNRTASASKNNPDTQVNNHVSSGGEGEDWDSPQTGEVSGGGGGSGRGRSGGQDRERPRQRGGGSGPPRMRGRGSLDNRGWRGRENKENERNLEEGGSGGFSGEGRRGRGRMSNGPMRSGRGGRGRMGPRTFQNKDKNSNQKFPCTIETWNNPSSEDQNDKDGDFPSPEDWDNEEYTGSLADSKVFTPSAGAEPQPSEEAETSMATGLIVGVQEQNNSASQPPPVQLSTSPVGVTALTPAQSQYLCQFTQSSESYKNTLNSVNNSSQISSQSYPPPPSVFTPSSVSCTSNFGATVNIYTSSHQELNSAPTQNSTARSKPQRPRLPPPSKIPSSAVEMPPGDAVNSGIAFLDVQFGGLEFGSSDTGLDNSIETSTPTPVPVSVVASVPAPSVTTPTVSAIDAYVTSSAQQTSIASALNQTQKLSSGESIIQTDPVVSSSYGANSVRSGTVVSGTSTTLAELTSVSSKTADVSSLSYGTTSEPTSIYQATSAYQKTSTPVYQTPVCSYNSSSYSTSTQVTSSSSVYNTSQVGGYASANAGGYTTSVNSVATSPSVNAYPNTNSYGSSQQTSGASSYQYSSYPTGASTGSGYQSGQPYPPQTAVSAVYGTYSYNNYSSANPPVVSTQQTHKMSGATLSSNSSKDSQYDSVPVSNAMTVAVSSITPVTTASSTPSLGLSGSSQTAAAAGSSTKVASIPAVSKSGVVQNIPPGVPPMLGTQYIMSQTTGGLQYYQPQVFGYDDAAIQVIQQRIPPQLVNPGGYFDLGFQPPTSLAAGRDALANVAYSVPDVRFTRADNNTSPVPSTLSQQSATQAAHQQPMINPTLPPTYAYFYGGSMFPGNFQYGPPLYPVAPTATASGHNNSTGAQYAKGPGGYSSGAYGSGYDTGSTPDYAAVKVGTGGSGYTTAPAQNKTGTGVGNPTGTNPSTTGELMYNKSHATLGKVNSYEKQGFHSGTPPPFGMTGNQNTGLPQTAYPPQFITLSSMPHGHHQSTTIMHQQPMHQMEMRNQGRRTVSTIRD